MAELLYLAGPIDATDQHDWHDDVHKLMLNETGWITYDPYHAFVVGAGTQPDNKIAHLNNVALHKASALIAYLPEMRTAGTFMEIGRAERMGIPIAWVGDDCWQDHWALQLRGIQRVDDFEAAVAYCIGTHRTQVHRNEQMTSLYVKRTHPNAQLPSKSYPDDAGFDLYVSEPRIINPDKWEDVPVGISIQPPPGMWFRIIGRSSTFRKRRLLVLEGIIDEGYRGELFVGVTNLGDEPAVIEGGERIAQMLPGYSHAFIQAVWSDSLSPHMRGDNGFGSTGV